MGFGMHVVCDNLRDWMLLDAIYRILDEIILVFRNVKQQQQKIHSMTITYLK